MKDVVIIGAGAAGLAAAAEVERAGRSYQLIEAQPWIGGRARTDRARFGVPVDLGCHWLHSPAQNPFAAAAERFGYRVRKGAQSEAYAWNGERLDAERFVDASAYVGLLRPHHRCQGGAGLRRFGAVSGARTLACDVRGGVPAEAGPARARRLGA